ncbi:MAG: cytidylate kinase-like family protein [Candidatus Daviesbacteria bacterium]|nr:cytidylate kinase-like family protein [Candidatus Daviesbacteria bacterium]
MKIFNIVNKNLQSSINHPFTKSVLENKSFPIITISREKGAGGIVVAEKLAKKLGKKWDYYHKDIVDQIAKESKTSPERVEELEEKPIPYLQDFLEGWIGGDGMDVNKYHKNLIKVLYALGSKGHSILVGRGANFIFPNSLKVRIIADKEQRIKWLMQYEKLSEKAATEEADETDKESTKFISNLYNKDITDPKNYDLVIKTSLVLPAEEAVDIIARVAKKRFKL